MDRQTTPQHGLTDEQRRQGSPAPRRRSRTRRDPGEDHVYRVPPQDFARTVQTLTGLRGTSTQQQPPSPALSVSDPGEDHVYRVPPQDFARTVQTLAGLRGTSTQQQPPSPALSVSVSTGTSLAAPRSIGTQMQEAYLAWCDANGVLLSPGTMAEMDQTARFDSNNSGNNND